MEDARGKILLIDDDPFFLKVLSDVFIETGFSVFTAKDGIEGVKAYIDSNPDVVITDLIMPGLDGHRLIEEIKKVSPQTPAILFSGKVKIYERDMQADIFLPKGMYAPVELLERIRLLLIRKRGPKRALPFAITTSGRAGVAAS